MKIRAILLDFDGTALQKDQVFISLRNMHALNQAMEKGVQVIPCTGRSADMMPPQIDSNEKIRYLVTSSGCRVIDKKTGEVIYASTFSPAETAALCRCFEGRRLYSEIAANGLIYIEKEVNDHLEHYRVPPHHVWFDALARQVSVEKPSEFFLQNNIGMEKCNIYNVPSEDYDAIYHSLEAVGSATFIGCTQQDIQFFPRTLDKIEAVQTLLDRLGISFDEVMSLGDSKMDEPMIAKAGVGVAMGNAPEWLKSRADYVTLPYDQDGVAVAIEKFVL